MRLWTMQPPEVVDILMSDGVFRCDYTKSENREPCFQEAYAWLIGKMRERIPSVDGVDYPVWAWHTYNGKHSKPDLRHSGFGNRGDKMVCLEIEIPDDAVVLSEFDDWHYVLNKVYLSMSKSSEEWEAADAYFDALPPDERDRVLVESWDNIFDLTPFENDWVARGKYIQATFWELRKENIVRMQKFSCR